MATQYLNCLEALMYYVMKRGPTETQPLTKILDIYARHAEVSEQMKVTRMNYNGKSIHNQMHIVLSLSIEAIPATKEGHKTQGECCNRHSIVIAGQCRRSIQSGVRLEPQRYISVFVGHQRRLQSVSRRTDRPNAQ